MHQYKTIAQTLLVLSVLKLVYAAPVVPQEVRDTGKDVVVVTKDVTTASERRRGSPPGGTAGTTPSQYSSPLSDGSPPHEPLPLDESAPLQGSDPSSGSAPSSHLWVTDGQAPGHDSTTEASTSAHPLSAADGPAPDSNTEASTSAHPLSAADEITHVPDSNTEASTSPQRPVLHDSTVEGATTPHYTAVTYDMLNSDLPKKSVVKKIAGLTIIGGFVAAVVTFSLLYNNHHNNTGG
ncbi:hypothetical protein F5888DRAFT_848808 [Russula emetica]|nr:hypothetical protein F5888DRAFT_848808 [Russula emetica]